MSLKTIKNKVRSVERIHTVTKAMEAVSAVKMRTSQERATSTKPYATSALSILQRVRGSREGAMHPLAVPREVARTAIIVVTSDKGLAGSLNSAVLRRLHSFIRERGLTPETVEMACLGKKGLEHFRNRKYPVSWSAGNDRDDVSIADMHELATLATSWFLGGRCDEVLIVYPSFASMFEQKPVIKTLLPISIDDVTEEISTVGAQLTQTEFEPSAEEVLSALLPHLLSVELFHALVEAKAAEHSARMVAMKNASDKAGELSDELTLDLNKARQALITREVSEIISGIETTTN